MRSRLCRCTNSGNQCQRLERRFRDWQGRKHSRVASRKIKKYRNIFHALLPSDFILGTSLFTETVLAWTLLALLSANSNVATVFYRFAREVISLVVRNDEA